MLEHSTFETCDDRVIVDIDVTARGCVFDPAEADPLLIFDTDIDVRVFLREFEHVTRDDWEELRKMLQQFHSKGASVALYKVVTGETGVTANQRVSGWEVEGEGE